MNKDGLVRLMPGIYTDDRGWVCVDMHEFLTAHGIPDNLLARLLAWQNLFAEFPDVRVYEIGD